MANEQKTGNRKCWRIVDVRDMTIVEDRLTRREADLRSGASFEPCRQGYRLIPCNGAAHSNAFIVNCMVCAPRWGWIMVKEVV